MKWNEAAKLNYAGSGIPDWITNAWKEEHKDQTNSEFDPKDENCIEWYNALLARGIASEE